MGVDWCCLPLFVLVVSFLFKAFVLGRTKLHSRVPCVAPTCYLRRPVPRVVLLGSFLFLTTRALTLTRLPLATIAAHRRACCPQSRRDPRSLGDAIANDLCPQPPAAQALLRLCCVLSSACPPSAVSTTRSLLVWAYRRPTPRRLERPVSRCLPA